MALCNAPFLHRFIDTRGKGQLCCAMSKSDKEYYNFDDWHGEDYQKIRNHMLTKEALPDVCRQCEDQEEVGHFSTRMLYDKLYNTLGQPSLDVEGGTSIDAPISYDLRLNNLCNLTCRMCGPMASSQIYKEAMKYPELWPGTKANAEAEFNQADISPILDEAHTMYELKLLGGEPTVQPQAKAILQRLIDIGNTSTNIMMTTNGTNVNKDFFDLIRQFKNVHIIVSIDNYGTSMEYLRGGSNWNKVWDNVRKIYEEVDWTGNFALALNQTVQTYNIFDFWNLRQKAYEDYPWIDHINNFIVYNPEMYSPLYIPKEWKDKAIEIAQQNNAYESEKHIFDIITKTDEDLEHMRKLKSYTPMMDFARNTFLKDHFPLCAELLEDIE
jgi:sulfatase maturation enzyme AslB (radical SAM superfamily)